MKTIADLPLMRGRPSWNPRDGAKRRLERGIPSREDIWQAWIAAFGPDCPDCGKEMVIMPKEDRLARHAMNQITLDHIRCTAAGGSNASTNFRCVCFLCNITKSNREDRKQIREHVANGGISKSLYNKRRGGRRFGDAPRGAIRNMHHD
jgi:hypothetical protein